jgi:hypothetical protein
MPSSPQLPPLNTSSVALSILFAGIPATAPSNHLSAALSDLFHVIEEVFVAFSLE